MYAELHALSAFSFQRGASLPPELVERAAELGYRALALTDECSMAGAVRAWQAGRDCGLPVIAGSEFTLHDGPKLVLLAETQRGYAGICGAITRGRRAAIKGRYNLQRRDLDAPIPEVCALWIPRGPGDVEELAWLRERYAGRLWIAVELHRDGRDAEQLQRLQALSQRFAVPRVASGDVHMHVRARRALQDVLTALRHHQPVARCGHRLFANGERHLRTLQDLQALYPPALLRETLHIAERCAFRLGTLKYDYPREIVPAGHTLQSWLRALVEQHIPERWPQGCPPEVRALIEKELTLITQKRYEAFFLTVYDIVLYARKQNILCQGRGSAANSVVCYTLGITAVDPGFTDLLFERFVSNERDEPPDIDVDFEHERREEVIQYVYDKYGRERAAIAATVIRYRPRSALRDVGRALDISAEVIDRVAKSLAWWDDPDGLPERLRSIGVDPKARAIRLWLRLARDLLEFPRHLSQHVGGFVISDAPLSELVPVENAAMPDRTIIQWDKDDLEALGLLKVDVLALGMLSALRRTFEHLRTFDGTALDLQRIPTDDAATYAMIGRAETLGVFQIESRAQMSMLPRLRPENLYDLTVQVAIVRPGPIEGDMVHPYLRRRAGLEAVDYPPRLKSVLGRTYGVPIFQEQVMRIAMVAAGFSADEADQVRRSMAAWKRSGGLEKFERKLKDGMAARGYDADFAERIYKQILGFGSYGFPESHAASFALLAYASAWLKCHHPAAFLCGLINSQPMGFYPVSMLVGEARRLGVKVGAVDVRASHWDCALVPDRQQRPAIRLGLRLVSGFNVHAGLRLADARRTRPFDSVEDLARRTQLNARELEALAAADALRGLAGHRYHARWQTRGHARLDGLLQDAALPDDPVQLTTPAEGEEILADYRSTGLSLRRHPSALLRERLERHHVVPNAQLQQIDNGQPVRVAGIVMFRQRPGTAKGTMFMTLEDDTGIVNLIIWPRLIERQRDIIVGAGFVLVRGKLQREQGVTHVLAEAFADRSHWLAGLPHLSRDFR
ncbi:error-prone DNA polymerase [Sinimarinibacterium sp. CAU 1509]|uniref:error-prone DNA polymerase n=1 Tax=Sinimarinibacterium sp. CAU 1509 TaxID=2562283 RepID=UPI0010AD8DEC|nr:error-prone DNA polymerase [Sinimarinibacterium sp. CAU 1509]TJY64923.1 error-prone DNA polymerase [Sinimarinibacterium sp. CAU 1509]